MLKTQTIDFSQARFKHLNWKFRIRNFLDGKENITEDQAISHEHCDLGKWFYSEGKAKYGDFESMKKFEAEHKKLHDLVKEIRLLKNEGKSIEAELLFKELLETSNTIVHLLNETEKIING